MSLILIGAGIGLVLFPILVQRTGRELVPSLWTWTCLACLVGGAALIEGALILYAAPTSLRAMGIPGLASLCQRMLNTLVPGGNLLGWLGSGLAMLFLLGIVLGTCGARREQALVRAEPGLGTHVPGDACDVVILDTNATVAVSISGRPNQIVVSEGLIQLLSSAELSAVLSHEAAHLKHRHQRFAVVANAVERGLWFLPFVRRTTRILRCAIERWADEDVVATLPDGRLHLQSALLKVSSTNLGAAMAFSEGDAVLERLHALREPVKARRIALGVVLAPGLLLGSAGLTGIAVTSATALSVLSAAGHCPL